MTPPRFEIVLAETAGFCMGVRRAVRMALDAADNPQQPLPIRTHGPLIHNRQVLRVLESRGITVMDEGDDGRCGTVVVRAHGLGSDRRQQLGDHAELVLDATCPHVGHLQRIVADHAARGYLCVLLGDAGHAEVEGVLSYAGRMGYVVAGPEDVAGLPPAEKVVVVAQTTQDEDLFRRTVEAVRRRFGDCAEFDTICRSTERRQAEVRELAAQVDAMIVVGGFHSANTRRLAEISESYGAPTFHIETEEDLDVDRILGYARVGLTAGASTPNWMIRRVIRRLQREHRRRSAPVLHAVQSAVSALVNSNLYAAGAAACLTFAAAHLLPDLPSLLPLACAVTFFFILGQHLLNQYGRREVLYLSEPERADFFMANERGLLWLGVAASVLAPALSWFLGWRAFGLVVLGAFGGLIYRLELPRGVSARLGLRSLVQLRGSKELFVGLAWGALAGAVPAIAGDLQPGAFRAGVVALGAAFVIAFLRTLTLDVGDVEADRLMGRETLASMLGPRKVRLLFFALVFLLAALLGGVGLWAGWTTPFAAPLLFSVPYGLACLLLLEKRGRGAGSWAELVTDGQFYLLAAAVLVWRPMI